MITQTEEYKAKAFELRNLIFFFLLAFGLSWIGAILIGILNFNTQTLTSITAPAILFLVFVVVPSSAGPTVAAFLVTAITEGKPGVKALWRRFWNRNLSLKWLLVTLLFYDTLRLVANLVARTIDGQPYPIVDTSSPLWMIIPLFLSAFISSGLGEEFGWHGYALPRFQAKWNALTSSIVLGLLWALWHVPYFFIHNLPLYHTNFLEWVPAILLSSVIYTWIFNNTKGSVLAAALFHAVFNCSIVVLPTDASTWYYYGILLLAVILIVIVFGPEHLVRQRPEVAE